METVGIINNEEFTGKPKPILEATKPILVFLYLRGAWEIADPRLYYYVNIILKKLSLIEELKIFKISIENKHIS